MTVWLARAHGRYVEVSLDSSSGLGTRGGCSGLYRDRLPCAQVVDVHRGLHRVTSRHQTLGFSGEMFGDAGLVGVSSPFSGFTLQSTLREIALSSTGDR